MRLENVEDVYALAPMQEGLLYHAVSEKGAGVYVTQVTAVLSVASERRDGLTVFRKAWKRLVERHGSLRTAFLWDGLDEPLQVVRDRAELRWTEEDWRYLDKTARAQRWAELLRADRARGFELETAPLMRMILARTADDEWLWAWSFHHLILDGWSTRLLLEELRLICAKEHGGSAAELGPPFPYSRFIAWHAERDHTRAEEFWRRELAGLAEPTPLALLQPSVPGRSAAMSQAVARLGLETTNALRSMAAGRRVTASTVLQGAWALLLARHAGVEDVAFGVTTSGRPPEVAGVERGVGLFINTLPLRVIVDPEAPLDAWLRALQKRQIETRRWEFSPLHAVQRWSDMTAGRALFDSIVVFENQPAAEPSSEDPGYELRGLEFTEQSNYPLALLVVPGERLELILVFDGTRVDSGDAAQVLRHLEALLESFVSRPEAPLAAQTMMSPEERLRALVEWNRTGWDLPPRGIGAYSLFDEIARGSSAPAVTCGERTVTYQELAEQAERLAAHLRSLGVGPEVLVGLAVERSVEMIVGLLGVLAADGAYLPLEPSHPAAYRHAVLEEAVPRVVLTTRDLLARVSMDGAVPVLLDEPETWIAAEVGELEPTPLGEPGERKDRLAYVIYTSGSEGRPKGVEVTDRNLVASTLARHRFYSHASHFSSNRSLVPKRAAGGGSGTAERFLLLSALSFDSSVAGIFWTLLSGGQLVLPMPGAERDLDAVRELIREHRITHTLCLPALYEVLLAEAAPAELESLEIVIVAGEACPASVAAAHFAAAAEVQLFNEYGPTEATVWCSVHEVLPEDASGPVPIGRPIANTRLYVLDGERQPVPVGVVGELYVAGEGVARGYLGKEDLTAERFVTLRLEGLPAERAYRTGDLARYRADGSLLFLGRADSQVKLRGHRIETAEVESALRRHPRVAEVAVAVRKAAERGRSGRDAAVLVAWVVERREGVATDAGDHEAVRDIVEGRALAGWLRERLPAFMIPDRWVPADRLPRTPNGKIDYRALRTSEPDGGDAFAAPRGETEVAIAAVWSELLGVDPVGASDNFYALGGDSILGIQIVSRLRQAGFAVEPKHVFAHPTVRQLAAMVGAKRTTEDDDHEERPLSGEVPLLPIQSWFLERELVAPHHWNLSRLFEVAVDLDPQLIAAALAHCMDHHDMLRARFERDFDGAWRQVVASPGEMPVPLAVLDLAAVQAEGREEARSRAIAEAQASLDLATGPLLRAVWFPAVPADDERSAGMLLLVVHHLVMDAASWEPLVADLWSAYEQLAAGERVSLPPRTAGFDRWARRLADAGEGTESPGEGTRQGSTATGADIPVDGDRGAAPTEADARISRVTLDRRRTECLLGAANDAYGTRVDDLLVVALARTLCRWSGESTLELALEAHGRPEDLDTSRTVGWFTVSYAVSLSPRPQDELGESIRSGKEQLRAARRDRTSVAVLHRAEPQVLFNYLSRVDGGAAAGPLRPVEGAESSSRDPRNARSHLLEINAAVRGGELVAEWIYCLGVHRPETVAWVSTAFVAELGALVDHCLQQDVGGFTASDFPAAELDADDLDSLLGRLEREER